jgi:hypothetical protein
VLAAVQLLLRIFSSRCFGVKFVYNYGYYLLIGVCKVRQRHNNNTLFQSITTVDPDLGNALHKMPYL